MSIYFLDAEAGDAAFFEHALAGETLRFMDRLSQVEADARVLSMFIHTHIDARFLDAHPALRLIATRSTGADHIDAAACRERGVTIANVPSYGEHTVAEHTLALILTLSRRMREVIGTPGKTDRVAYEPVRAFDLRGKTLGVIGAGRIGQHVIRMAKAFGMKVLTFDIAQNPCPPEVEDCEAATLERLLAEAHIVTLHVPLLPETHHILNRDALARCRRGVIVINTARGGLIDTDALLEALASGQVGGAGLDVLEEDSVIRQEATSVISEQIVRRLHTVTGSAELHDRDPGRVKELENLLRNQRLLARPDVIFTPHVAFNSVEAITRINQTTAENIRLFLRGEASNLVNPDGSSLPTLAPHQ